MALNCFSHDLVFNLKYLNNKCKCYSACKRATYDQYGEEGLKRGVPTGSMAAGAWTQGYTFHGDVKRVFRDFFGGDNPYQGG